MAILFSEFKVKDLILKNRIVMPPMCMYCAGTDGKATKWHEIHYATRAIGGTGLLIVEATGIAPEGRISSADLGLWEDAQIPGLKGLAETVHAAGAKIGIQLNHAGRKCDAKDVEIEAPSALAFQDGSRVPREMTKTDIAETVLEFRDAAKRALEAGFDVVEIHAAHGYLLNEFLSPITNRRVDEYGGSLENRTRILAEVITAVRTVWPAEKPLDLRITAEDYQEGGNVATDLASIINMVKALGIDMVNVSTGGLVPVMPTVFPGYQVPHAELIKQATGLPVAAGGLLTDPAQAEEILEAEKADLVYIGRELLRNPYWPLGAAKMLDVEIEWPKQYERAKLK